MIRGSNYLQKAHRLSQYRVADTVTTVQPGQHFHLNDDSEWEYADGTRKSYPTLNSRYAGAGLGSQGELLEGRDDVSRAGKLACLKGNYELETDQYDKTKSYTPGSPLVAIAGGLVAPVPANATNPIIIGYVTVAPTANDEFITYEA